MDLNFQLTNSYGPVVHGRSNMEDIYQELQLLKGYHDVRDVSGHTEEKQAVVYHRMKWTDEMVNLLITALSYVRDDFPYVIISKKGKWKAISGVMAERGHHISPQQCEDKFNDLNKKYKRLNDVLGRGTACRVVENPVLLESMALSDELKGEMNSLINCRQLFYQQLCSYHNQNRLFLPHDQQVQQYVLLAVKHTHKYEPESILFQKRKTGGEEEGVSNPNLLMPPKKRLGREERVSDVDVHCPITIGGKEVTDEDFYLRSLELEEKKLKIQAQFVELKKERLLWKSYCHEQDEKLQKMKLENEAMKLENQCLALQLKRRGMQSSD